MKRTKYIGNFGDVGWKTYGGDFVLIDKENAILRAIKVTNLEEDWPDVSRSEGMRYMIEDCEFDIPEKPVKHLRDIKFDIWIDIDDVLPVFGETRESVDKMLTRDFEVGITRLCLMLRDHYGSMNFGGDPEYLNTIREVQALLITCGVPKKEVK